jgi:uncharacterized membrane protein YjgN (DUF898 family)
VLACFGKWLFWAACGTSLLWVISVIFVGANVAHPDWTISVAVALIGAFVIWILARAVRYLAGLQPKRGLS